MLNKLGILITSDGACVLWMDVEGARYEMNPPAALPFQVPLTIHPVSCGWWMHACMFASIPADPYRPVFLCCLESFHCIVTSPLEHI